MVKNLPANAGDMDSVPGLARFPGEGNGKPLRYSGLRNPMDRGVWWAAVHGVAKELDINLLTKQQLLLRHFFREKPAEGTSSLTI